LESSRRWHNVIFGNDFDKMVKLLGMPELSSLLTKAKNENLNYSKKNGLDTNSLNFNNWGKQVEFFFESIGGTIQTFFYLTLITIYHNYKDG